MCKHMYVHVCGMPFAHLKVNDLEALLQFGVDLIRRK